MCRMDRDEFVDRYVEGNDDEFRYCVHCGADCHPPFNEQEHKSTCPSVTGVWPVMSGHWHTCPRCKHTDVDMQCYDCGSPFAIGDVYMLRDSETGQLAVRPEVGEVICIGCASAVALG